MENTVHPFGVVKGKQGSDTAALEAIANDIEMDDDSVVVGLDLVGVPLDPDLSKTVAALKGLRKLRIDSDIIVSHSGYESSYAGASFSPSSSFLEILQVPKLTSLEIPSGLPLGDEGLAAIGELKGLQRLQLPFAEYGDPPERKPTSLRQFGISTEPAEFAWLVRSRRRHGRTTVPGYEDLEAYFTAAGLANLAKLTQLDSLFIPGYLLDTPLTKLVAGLPQLVELHAPFGLACPEDLSILASNQNLRSLTIGIHDDTFDNLVAMRDKMPPLTTLQLTMIVEQQVDDDLRSRFQERLRNAFPDAETHIFFISEPQ